MAKRGSAAPDAYYCGPATLSDGTVDANHEVEIFVRTGGHATVMAWHVVLKEKLPPELRSPHGKTVSVRIGNGAEGLGTMVDPRHIRGAGQPPSK